LKKLGFAGTITLVVGNIIGVGIFTTTGYLTTYIHSPLLILLAWIIGAFYALSGGNVYGVLSKAYPLSGGDYQYLKNELHPLAGYIFGWSAFFITYSGSIAALGIAAAHYTVGIINLPDMAAETYTLFASGSIQIEYNHIKSIAILFILGFSYVNYKGILLSGKYQIGLTLTVSVLLIMFTLSGLISPKTNYEFLTRATTGSTGFSGFLVALIAVLFSYSGWTTVVYVAEEIDQAPKTVPKALITGVIVIGILYILINFVYLVALPLAEMKGVINIAALVFNRLWGDKGAIFISIIIIIAIFSSLNSTILSGPRIYQAMGREGLFFGLTRKLHPKYNSPYRAIILQMIWSIILVLSGGFNELLSFVVFVMTLFSFFAAFIAWQIKLRSKQLNILNRFSIGFYGLLCLTIMINTLIQKPFVSVVGILILLPAIPFYYFDRYYASIKN
jgi:APA family basic amino acid/polyamine antiporter